MLCATEPGQTQLYMKSGDVMLVCKAYNGRVVAQWLTEILAEVSQQEGAPADDHIAPVALCMRLAYKTY